MYVKIIYYAFLGIILLSSIYFFSLLLHKNVTKIKFKRYRIKEIQQKTIVKLDNKEIDNVFYYSGLNIKGYMYMGARYVLFGVWALIIISTYIIQKHISSLNISLCMVMYLVTSPKVTFAGYKTPFALITMFLTKEYRDKKNKEVYSVICQLKNIASIDVGDIGSDYILEHLIKFTDHTKTIFSTMIKMWYEYDSEKACDYFAKAIDTEEGKNLADIFRKLDDLNPTELKEQLSLYQSSFDTNRQTAKERKNENRGFILYSLVIISAMSVFFNFVVIVLILDTILKINNY
jgi:hypothetical protein